MLPLAVLVLACNQQGFAFWALCSCVSRAQARCICQCASKQVHSELSYVFISRCISSTAFNQHLLQQRYGVSVSPAVLQEASTAECKGMCLARVSCAPAVPAQVKAVMNSDYIPNFKTAFQHFLVHTGGRAVIEEVEKKLSLAPADVQPSKETLFRYGNTCCAAVFYVLTNMESRVRAACLSGAPPTCSSLWLQTGQCMKSTRHLVCAADAPVFFVLVARCHVCNALITCRAVLARHLPPGACCS